VRRDALSRGPARLHGCCQSTPRNAGIQLGNPDPLRRRGSALQNMLLSGRPGLGQTLMGAVASALLVPGPLLAGAATCAGINLVVLVTRRDLRARDLAMDNGGDEADVAAASNAALGRS